jgi:ADP-heptose:LPS heptosyltransferase
MILADVRWRLGDEIMALPIYEALRMQHPDSRIHVLCTYPDLLEDNPYVDAVNGEPGAPDKYVCLRSGPRDVHRIEHYARCAGAATPAQRPRLYYRDWSAPQLAALPRGGRPLGARKASAPLVALGSGASWPIKRWPIERWRALGGALVESGFHIVELGRTEDEAINVGTSLRGKTSVREAACVLRAADLLVCCDSGLMHLALAAGTRVLALFGPTDPTILVRNEPNLTVIGTERDCRGCWNLSKEAETPGACPLGRATCLDAIDADRVLAQTRALLSPET